MKKQYFTTVKARIYLDLQVSEGFLEYGVYVSCFKVQRQTVTKIA